jgi:hypothetical protein
MVIVDKRNNSLSLNLKRENIMNKQETKKLQNEQNRKTAEAQKNRAQELAQETANPFIDNTKHAYNAVLKSNTSLFVSIKAAYEALYVPEAHPDSPEMLAFTIYKSSIISVFDRSSFNKCVRICKNDLIMSNLDRLPVAWSTLSKLDSILTSDESLHSVFIEKLDSNEINVRSTENAVIKMFTKNDEEDEDADCVESTEPVVTYDSTKFTGTQLVKLRKAFKTLEELGFTIEDQSAESED